MSYIKQLQLYFNDSGIPAEVQLPIFNLNPRGLVCWRGSGLLPPPGSASSSISLRMTLRLDYLDLLFGLHPPSTLPRRQGLEPQASSTLDSGNQTLAGAPGSHLSESGVASRGVSENDCWQDYNH